MAKVENRSRLARWVEQVLQVGAPMSPARAGAESLKHPDERRSSRILLDS